MKKVHACIHVEFQYGVIELACSILVVVIVIVAVAVFILLCCSTEREKR